MPLSPKEYRAYQKLENEVNMVSHLVENSMGRKKKENKPKYMVVTLTRDMWPPHFLAGTKCRIQSCTLDKVKYGSFILVRYLGHMHVVRMVGWRYADDKMSLKFIPNPKEHRVVTLDSLEFLGKVVEVVHPLTGAIIDPNRVGFLHGMWNSITNYGTLGCWRGLYKLLDTFVGDAKIATKTAEKQELTYWQGVRRINEWSKEQEEKKALAAAIEQEEKGRRKSPVDGQDIEYRNTEILEDDTYDEAKRKLAHLSSTDFEKWWTVDERLSSNSGKPE